MKTIADEGNIAKSSERLFLTQSALSHQLKELELQLGVKVFVRKRNEWKLTDEGKELYLLADSVLVSIDEKLKHIKTIKQNSGGKIRISCECFTFYQLFPEFLQEMKLLYSDIQIEFVFEATHRPTQKILDGEVDIAIVTSKSHNESFFYKKIMSDELFMLMHEEHVLNKKAYVEAGDFVDVDLLIHSLPLETVSVYENFLKPNHVFPKSITPIPLTEVAMEMVSSNTGVMCVPKWSLKSFRIPETLVFKPMTSKGLGRDLFIAMKGETKKLKHTSDFINTFDESIQKFLSKVKM